MLRSENIHGVFIFLLTSSSKSESSVLTQIPSNENGAIPLDMLANFVVLYLSQI